jgi:hypothetical protein
LILRRGFDDDFFFYFFFWYIFHFHYDTQNLTILIFSHKHFAHRNVVSVDSSTIFSLSLWNKHEIFPRLLWKETSK